MNCLSPIVLKNGLCVPCGKCDICRSNVRNEWSIRLAIHLESCQQMPMFITLTYDDKYLPLLDDEGLLFRYDWKDAAEGDYLDQDFKPTLWRKDVSSFLKKYKRKYNLRNEEFQYFGCGEYGENFRRPHYHLLFFGEFELYDAFFRSTEEAQNRISKVWNKGFVHVGIAGFDGIHYVTKYCLKDDLEWIPDDVSKPFTIASNGLGMNFLDSTIGKKIVSRLEFCQRHKEHILDKCPYFDYDDKDSINDAIRYLETWLPRFEVILDDGRKVFLPRAIRKKLVGSFEHFKDNPYWLLNALKQLRDSFEYYRQFGEYDMTHDVNVSYQQCLVRVEKIRKRYLENKYNSKIKQL